jgi:hypothetical protein
MHHVFLRAQHNTEEEVLFFADGKESQKNEERSFEEEKTKQDKAKARTNTAVARHLMKSEGGRRKAEFFTAFSVFKRFQAILPQGDDRRMSQGSTENSEWLFCFASSLDFSLVGVFPSLLSLWNIVPDDYVLISWL